jgi:hypothetical protein
VPVSLFDLVLLAALGLGLLVAARWLAQQIGLVPEILWLTTIALVLAQLPRVRRLSGAEQLGNLGLHLFFVVIGVRSLFRAMLQVGPEVFLYTLVVVALAGAGTAGHSRRPARLRTRKLRRVRHRLPGSRDTRRMNVTEENGQTSLPTARVATRPGASGIAEHRRRLYQRHLLIFLAVNGGLLAADWFTSPGLQWGHFLVVPWFLVFLLHTS